MNQIWINLLVVLFFVLLGGFFAAAELALVSLRENQVQRLAESSRRGRRLASLTADPNRFLAAVQVGVTLAGFVSAGFGAAQIAPELAQPLISAGLAEGVAQTLAFIVITVLIAYLSLVLGELVPKRIALQRVEKVALFAAGPIDFIARLFRPFIVALSFSTNVIVRIFGIDPTAGKESISGEELRDLVAGHEELSEDERNLIDDVFEAGERELREVMLPRTEVDFLDSRLPVADAVRRVVDQPHSRYPVIRGSADDVVGFVHIRDILDPDASNRGEYVSQMCRPVVAFPGSKVVLETLTEMRRDRHHLAIVQDEYGGTAGIVTMEDLVEELIGDIKDEYDVDAMPRQPRVLGQVVVDGLLNLEDFEDETGVVLPDGPYETVAGFLVAALTRLPVVGDTVVEGDNEFRVVELDGRRISRVSVTSVQPAAPVAESDPDLED
ncbi:MAG: hemolysin family protein [Candidatus Nanopelagicales bacterium]|nr:HlyC/CorC family transporter [Actinomycetota bacterium]NDA58725.1 HlyC/CorC family transporter [Actinomycetota bacterium]NDG94420.1 HlyC/CorC family transporter [Actinomycetota bacterium]NDH13726.1 HlyC/CorC family transporter [Actinomycetota bacterium]NDH18142.1 HlyC/CorC family transporter [Actinomycetota bacterium]